MKNKIKFSQIIELQHQYDYTTVPLLKTRIMVVNILHYVILH